MMKHIQRRKTPGSFCSPWEREALRPWSHAASPPASRS